MSRIMHKCFRVWAIGASIGLCSVDVASAGKLEGASAVHCFVKSARLNFGRLNLQRPSPLPGEGEVVVSCQNTSKELQRVTLSLVFPTLEHPTVLLRSDRGTLSVGLYKDAKFQVAWGDGMNGAAPLQLALEFTPGEDRLVHLPVHGLLVTPRVAAAGVYLSHVPVTLSTLQR